MQREGEEREKEREQVKQCYKIIILCSNNSTTELDHTYQV